MQRGGSIYILTNRNNTTLYIGVTADLITRLQEHREKRYPNSFTARYNLNKLIYFESFASIEEAIAREKQIKDYSRKKKEKLIFEMNPEWEDLSDELE